VFARQAASLFIAAAATVSNVAWTDLNHGARFVRHVQYAVTDALIGPDYSSAAVELERYHELAGTYVGAELPTRSMTLRWATVTFYCVEGQSTSGAITHLIGPHGSTASGPCPGY
jgi:hypothetical protein